MLVCLVFMKGDVGMDTELGYIRYNIQRVWARDGRRMEERELADSDPFYRSSLTSFNWDFGLDQSTQFH